MTGQAVAVTLHGVRPDGSDHRMHGLRVITSDAAGGRAIVGAPDVVMRTRGHRTITTHRTRYDMRQVRAGTRVTLHLPDGVDRPGTVVRGYGQRISLQITSGP